MVGNEESYFPHIPCNIPKPLYILRYRSMCRKHIDVLVNDDACCKLPQRQGVSKQMFFLVLVHSG